MACVTRIEAGDITYKNVLKVQPFGNTLVYVDMKGSEVEPYLAAVANMKVDSGAYAQFANVSLVADGKGVSDVKIKGEPLQADKTYRMATLNFNALGGDGYPKIRYPAKLRQYRLYRCGSAQAVYREALTAGYGGVRA